MKASIVIATYNRDGLVVNTLSAILSQTFPKEETEVIIVDDGSTDSTAAKIEQFLLYSKQPHWQYIRYTTNRGKATALNIGIEASTAPLVIFTDDDCIPDRNWVEAHVNRHAQADSHISVLGSVTFPTEWLKESNFVRYANSRYVGNRSIRSMRGDFNDLSPGYFAGLNISTEREQLLRVGLFDERVGRGQDVELGYRLWKAGVKLVYEPQAFVVHYEPEVRVMRKRIEKQAKAYHSSVPILHDIHPELTTQFGNWFYERLEPGSDSLKRIVLKLLIRLLVHKSIARLLLDFLERMDRWRLFYNPLMYHYVVASAYLESVRRREV